MADMFELGGKTAAITGGAGILCKGIARHLAERGMHVAVLDLDAAAAEKVVQEIMAFGGKAVAVACNVLQKESVQQAAVRCEQVLGHVDVLINGAGGNHPMATTGPDRPFFEIPIEAFEKVLDLNIIGTVLPSMVFAKMMAQRGEGVILNIASMNAFRPLTRIPAYSAAKSGVKNFTEWLAVHLAQEYSPKIRVNGIAPGFLLTNQNRFLLLDEKTGQRTARGQAIIDHTPMGRYGEAEDLYGTVSYLLSDASRFVTGVTIPIDGGFNAFSGV